MTEEIQVEITSDTGEKLQWGTNLFFFKDGGKFTIRRKALLSGCGLVILAVAILQCFDPAYESVTVGRSVIELPIALSSQKEIGIEETPKDSVKANKTNTAVPLKLTGPQLVSRPRDLGLIPPGSMLSAVLLSGASNGLVRAKAKEALTVNGTTFIEEGATFLGQGSSTEERLLIAFNQVVFKDGTFGQIEAQACDKTDQIVGLKGSKIGSKTMNIIGSIGLGFVGGMAEGLTESRAEQGVALRTPSMKNALLSATTRTALEQSQSLMSDLKNQHPIIEVPNGAEICVIFAGGK